MVALAALAVTGTTSSANVDGLVQHPAHILSVAPLGDSVLTNAAITVTFSQAMDPDMVALSIEPSASGDLVWSNESTLRFQPLGLVHGTTYQVHVHGVSSSGARLQGRKRWQFTTVAGPPAATPPGAAVVRVPILLYHYVRVVNPRHDYLGYRLSVTPENFAAQMNWLHANGYHPVTTHQVLAFLNGQSGLPTKPIVLTFDDGYSDFFTAAAPILRKHDFTAVNYVVSGLIGRSGYMSAQQLLAVQSAGFEIGSHTVDHVDLTRQSNAGLSYQLATSKRALEELLGRPVLAFCYPYGKFGAREMAAVAAAGYQDATTTLDGPYHTMANRFAWGRIRVNGDETLAQFSASVLAES